MQRLKSKKHFLHVLKNATPQVRKTILQGADDSLIKAILECILNTLNGNHKVSSSIKNKLCKYKKCLRQLSNPKYSIKKKRKLLVQHGGFLGALLTSLLSGLVGKLIQ